MRLATSSCNPACRHSRFSARNCANAFCHSRLQTLSSHQIDQRLRSDGDSTTQIRRRSDPFKLAASFTWNQALATLSCTFCRPHIPQVFRRHQFLTIFLWNGALANSPVSSSKSARRRRFLNILKCISGSRYRPARFLSTTFPNRATNPRKHGDPTSASTDATCYTSQLLGDGWLTWLCGWHRWWECSPRQSSVTRKFSS